MVRYKSVCPRVDDKTDYDNCTSTTFWAQPSSKTIFMTKPIQPTTIEIIWPERKGNLINNHAQIAELEFIVCK